MCPNTIDDAWEQHVLRTSDLEYDLPESAIATTPASPRDSARMLVMQRGKPDRREDRVVTDLPNYLRPGDLLVVNASRVLRARFEGVRLDTNGHVEGLFLSERAPGLWHCLIKAKRVRPSVVLAIGRGERTLHLRAERPDEGEPGSWLLTPLQPDGSPALGPAAELLEAVGLTPLPPYILRARRHAGQADDDTRDHEVYQTVYAGDASRTGSVAAPTAGLHFTPTLLAALRSKGVQLAEVTLHVGTGTFRPVEAEFVEQHPMHAEWCSVPPDLPSRIAATRATGGRVFAVGTTAARTLESFAQAAELGPLPPSLSTKILITPGYRWQWVDGLLTNFHLPRSTLMAMVAALLESARTPGAGVASLLSHYRHALAVGYRFYSFGDASLVLPEE